MRVRYADTDQMGVAYYANYLAWFEVGRTELLRALGWTYREMEAAGVALPVLEATCRYIRPAYYDDELDIRTTGKLVSPVQLAFEYDVVRAASGETLATGRTRHAGVNPHGRPCRLPERVRELFT